VEPGALTADEVDLSARAFWEQPAAERQAAFAVLRRERPISRQGPPESVLLEPEEGTGGYWAVVRYDDVQQVSRDPDTFSSARGVMFDDAPEELLEASQSFLATDAPRHTQLRGLVKAAFTPKQVQRIESQIQANAGRVVDELESRGDCDFVEHVSSRLPMLTLWGMFDLPDSEHEPPTNAANDLVGWNDPDVVGDREPVELMFEGVVRLSAAAAALADQRREQPGEDLMTALVEAEVEGERLTDADIGAFFVLLAVAGNDTTRHSTSHAMRALTEFPEQRALLIEDLDGRIDTAVEEFVRWATPVMTFRRTATHDTELRGQAVAEGEKVVMFYTSANRDEAAFTEPERFDLLRHPNRHCGFGGGGPHYCLGAPLARMQLRSIFTELLTRLPRIETGEPEPLVGNFINGIKRMPCSLDG